MNVLVKAAAAGVLAIGALMPGAVASAQGGSSGSGWCDSGLLTFSGPLLMSSCEWGGVANATGTGGGGYGHGHGYGPSPTPSGGVQGSETPTPSASPSVSASASASPSSSVSEIPSGGAQGSPVSETPSGGVQGGGLPVTGFSTVSVTTFGALLLLGGAVILFVVRPRRAAQGGRSVDGPAAGASPQPGATTGEDQPDGHRPRPRPASFDR
jgi:hypothetical protein